MRDFEYRRATTIGEASDLARQAGAILMAGGQGLVLDLRWHRRRPSLVVDIGSVIPREIALGADGVVVIYAGATHADIASSPLIREHLPVLAALAEHVGDPAVRRRGTLGGALAINDPAGDWPAACLGLDAEIATTERTLRADAFLAEHDKTLLRPGEIILSVAFKPTRQGGYLKFLNPASRYGIVGAFAAFIADGPRVAVTGARVTGAFRWQEAEARLGIERASEALISLTPPTNDLITDFFADPTYRSQLIGVLTRRAVSVALTGKPGNVAMVHGAARAPSN